jgi:hypothetical protein
VEPETPPVAAKQATATEVSVTEPVPLAQEQSLAPAQEQTPATTEMPAAEAAVPDQEPPQPASADSDSEPTPTSGKPKRQRKAPAGPKKEKISALDAAARVLAEENRAMTCKEMIEAMAAKGYWSSPGGKTPEATLYSAILRELTTKGAGVRFAKVERGKFARNAGT